MYLITKDARKLVDDLSLWFTFLLEIFILKHLIQWFLHVAKNCIQTVNLV